MTTPALSSSNRRDFLKKSAGAALGLSLGTDRAGELDLMGAGIVDMQPIVVPPGGTVKLVSTFPDRQTDLRVTYTTAATGPVPLWTSTGQGGDGERFEWTNPTTQPAQISSLAFHTATQDAELQLPNFSLMDLNVQRFGFGSTTTALLAVVPDGSGFPDQPIFSPIDRVMGFPRNFTLRPHAIFVGEETQLRFMVRGPGGYLNWVSELSGSDGDRIAGDAFRNDVAPMLELELITWCRGPNGEWQTGSSIAAGHGGLMFGGAMRGLRAGPHEWSAIVYVITE